MTATGVHRAGPSREDTETHAWVPLEEVKLQRFREVSLRQQLDAALERVAAVQSELDQAKRQLAAQRKELNAKAASLAQAEALALLRSQQLDAMRLSTSWRLTAPVRWFAAKLGGRG